MKVKILTLAAPDFPDKLKVITQPPSQLYILGNNVNELLSHPCVTVVGSRKVSAYGSAVTVMLATELAKAGITIISGLALGVDSLAHAAALEVGGPTIAVLPTGLDRIYPARHRDLARRITEQGGALITEYKPNARVYPSNFIARNRIATAISDAVLITEAAERSGTLSTARFALEQGKEVLAVPGNITSPTSAGTNNLIKSGATPVTCAADVLHALGLEPATGKRVMPTSTDPHEQVLLALLWHGATDGTELLTASRLDISLFNQALTMLEIKGLIRPLGGNQWALT